MAKKQKVYAVKKGAKTGLFYTWEECQFATKGYSSPEFKSFESEEEAKAYLADEDIIYNTKIAPLLAEGKVVAFVDGSFNKEKLTYGYGIYILTSKDNTPVELCGKSSNPNYIDMQNAAGEILGAMFAIDWAWKNGFDSIVIFHDHEGLYKWISGEWKTKSMLSSYYKQFIEDKKEILQIEFIKVSGHSNNKYNDRADALAKASVRENKILKDLNGNSGYIINNISQDSVFGVLQQLKLECPELDFEIIKGIDKCKYSVVLKKDKVTLSVFKNIRLLVQGKISNLFQLITTGIIERLDCVDFVKVLRGAYGKPIDISALSATLFVNCPNLKNVTLPQNIEKLLNQSIVDLEEKGYNDIEFSKYTLAALRALEGVLKFNLNKYNINVPIAGFNMFEKHSNGLYSLKQSYRGNIPHNDIIKMENCYNHYYNNRHTLCHFGYVFQGIDTNTRLLTTKNEANSIIKSTLKIINDNYIV